MLELWGNQLAVRSIVLFSPPPDLQKLPLHAYSSPTQCSGMEQFWENIYSDLLLYGDLVIYFLYFQGIKINYTIASTYFPVKAICFLMKQCPYYLPRKFFVSAGKQCFFYSVSCFCETTFIQLSTQARNLGGVLDISLLLTPISSPQVSYLCLLNIS